MKSTTSDLRLQNIAFCNWKSSLSLYSCSSLFLTLFESPWSILVHSHNMAVHSFVRSFTAEYVGLTTRQLKTRINEHHPRWLRTGERKSIRSSVVSHLVDSGHVINPVNSFRVLFRAPPNLPGSIRSRYIETAEAVAIRLRDPILCNQKRFVQTLHLPWPFCIDHSTQSINTSDHMSSATATNSDPIHVPNPPILAWLRFDLLISEFVLFLFSLICNHHMTLILTIINIVATRFV